MARCAAASVSVMIMRPPQHGHGLASVGDSLSPGGGILVGFVGTRRYGVQLTGARDVVDARAAGEQAIVADAVEAAGQHVDEEAADELVGSKRHRLEPVA